MNVLKAAAIVVVILVAIIATTVTIWSKERFSNISLCLVCHELFVEFDEYAPQGEVSQAKEEYNPSTPYEPGLYDVPLGCGECHMHPYEEYRESAHYDNERDVKPGCVGCHEPHSAWQLLRWKFLYYNDGRNRTSPFHEISTALRDLPLWEEKLRPAMAAKVRTQFQENQSEKCKRCHDPESEWWNGIKSHQRHKAKVAAGENDESCIDCHYNLVHDEVYWAEKWEE